MRRAPVRDVAGRAAPLPVLLVIVAALVVVVLVVQNAGDSSRTVLVPPPPAGPVVKISGNTLVDQDGRPVRLLGFNRSGTEYACVQGFGIFEGPVDDGSVAAMVSWRANAVRLPLNEDCWLGINGVHPELGGEPYRRAIGDYVQRLHKAGLFVVLDLHWSAPGTTLSDDQWPMADADHSPAFWRSVATFFRDDRAVLFDLFNEPNSISWECWRDGCVTGDGWAAAGMQSLVDAVRGTGATQPLIVTGLAWGNDLSSWLAFRPHDPAGQIAAGFHLYNHNRCSTVACWDAEVGPVAASFPVVTGEFGQNDCGRSFIDSYMRWADGRGLSYVGWAWNQWSCEGHGLIASYDGTPTVYGAGLRDHLVAVNGAGAPQPSSERRSPPRP